MFIKNANILSAQYTISRQKKIARLLKKIFFKVVTINSILSNIRIFNFYFLNKIKNPSTNKIYKKHKLVV